MAKKKGSRRSRSRSVPRGHRRRGMTPIKGLKYLVALLPPAVAAYEGYKAGGVAGMGSEVEKAFTGYDFQNRTFAPQNLVVGYGGVLGAYAIGKIYSRVLR